MSSKLRMAVSATAVLASLAGPVAGQDPERPRLVVVIVVDQLRADLLDRFQPAFDGGFRRMLRDGYRFTGASHPFAVTHTAAGHASLATGVFPSRSGIVANNWTQRVAGNWTSMYAVEDVDAPILGFETVAQLPGRSPRNLLRSGLADWVRDADPEARVVSLSSKDRSAITMGGHGDAEVYWLLSPLARFVTSTHYKDAYPEWVVRYNEQVMPGIAADTVWNNDVPWEHRGLARADSAVYEADGVHTTFPHLSPAASGTQQHNAWAFNQPRADAAVLGLAEAAIEALDLGQRGHLDFLAVSLSAADYVGHGYGPLSQEQLANLVHLDRRLGAFLDVLDDAVGEGRWVAGLSADHGVATMPEYLREMGDTEAERIDSRERSQQIAAVFQEVSATGLPEDEVAERTARLLEERGLVAKAYTHRELTLGQPADSFATLFRNSHYPGRAHHPLSPYGIEYRFGFQDLVSFPTGTTHGAPYWYDRWVPFILFGAGVEPGSSDAAVYTIDLAPTLAGLAGVPFPDDLDGRPVYR